MRTKYILGLILSAALLFTGCMKEDIDELRRQQAENAERIAALEQWQATVNDQITSLQGLITALESNDYVTGVTPFTTPAPGGYTITFTKSAPVTIYHGSKGDTGAAGSTPVIGVAEYPSGSGVYYWTVNDEWLTDDGTPTGNKVPVTGEKGADGATPTVEIGANGNWFINGVDTGVKATGADGSTPVITIGANGNWYVNGADTGVKAQGNDGATPTVEIGGNGNWFINGVDTGVKATGADGSTPVITIGANGNWHVNGADTGVKATGNNGTDGTNGSTPKVIIGSDGYWYISADGTATGTPPGGSGWALTGVQATGDKGDKGDKGDDGDSMFADVDDTNDDCVIITLNDGPPQTTITLSKYKAIGISYSQPGAFIAGQEYRVAYTSTGTANPTDIRVTNVPNGWAVIVDKSAGEFVITPPADFSAAGVEFGKATIWLDEGNKIAAMYNLDLQNRRIAANAVGEYFYQNGTVAGVIYKVNDGTPNSGKIVSLTHTWFFMWADINNLTFETGATDAANGFNNMKTIASLVGNGTKAWSNFPPFDETHKRNDPAETYSESSVGGVWYLPAIDEWTEFFTVFNTYGQTAFNALLTSASGNSIGQFYWSSTENSPNQAYLFDQLSTPKELLLNKNGGNFFVRGICRF